MKHGGKAVVALLGALLQGCAVYSEVQSGRHSESEGVYAFETPVAWSARGSAPRVWTVDGEGLEFMMHFEGVADGEELFKELPDELGHAFVADMKPTEIIDLFIGSFSVVRGGRDAVRMLEARPADFGPWAGFRFSFACESDSGIPMRGVAAGAIISQRLYLMAYVGVEDRYFDKRAPDIERIFSSITRT